MSLILAIWDISDACHYMLSELIVDNYVTLEVLVSVLWEIWEVIGCLFNYEGCNFY